MKNKIFYSLALVVMLCFATTGATAQELVLPVEIPTLENPKILDPAQQALNVMLENPEKATTLINKAIKATKGDKGQMMALAMWFNEQEGGGQAAKYVIEDLYKTHAEDIDVMLVAGDIYGTLGLWGRAGQKYDQVLQIEPENIYALTQGARIYKNHNPDASLAMWEKLYALQPNNTLAMRNIGDLLYEKNYVTEALEYYGKYYDNIPHTKDAINAASMEQYLIGLFFSENQEQRLKEVGTQLYEVDSNNLLYNRFAFIGTMLTYDSIPATLQQAQKYATYLTSGKTPDSLLIYQDFFYAYQMAEAAGQYEQGLVYLTKAVQKDPEQTALLRYAAINLNSNGQYAAAAEYYKKYCELSSDVTEQDYLNIITIYREGASSVEDAAEKVRLRDLAMEAIDTYKDKIEPASQYKLTLEKANILNSMPDKDEAQIMALYDEVLQQNKAVLSDDMKIQLAQQLMFYHVRAINTVETEEEMNETMNQIRKYCDAILDIDPFNEQALEIDDILHTQGK